MSRRMRPGGRRKAIDPWRVLYSILSGIFMTVGLFLILMAVGEVIVYLIDVVIMKNTGYMNWWSTPLMMVIVSLPFFLGYMVVNLNRFSFYRKLRSSINMPSYLNLSEDLDDIEID